MKNNRKFQLWCVFLTLCSGTLLLASPLWLRGRLRRSETWRWWPGSWVCTWWPSSWAWWSTAAWSYLLYSSLPPEKAPSLSTLGSSRLGSQLWAQPAGRTACRKCACVCGSPLFGHVLTHVCHMFLLQHLFLEQLLWLLWLIGVACYSLSAIWVKSERAKGKMQYLREWTHKSGQQSQMCVSTGYHRQVHVGQIPCCKRLSLRISRHHPNWPRCILPGSAWLGPPGILHCCCNQLSFWHITEALVNMGNPINVFSNYIMTRA